MNKLVNLFFPIQSRHFPYQRLVLDLLRSTHILCVSIFLGGLFFSPDAAQLQHWLLGIILSGLGLLAIEIYRTAAILFELRGLMVLSKLALLFYMFELNHASQLTLMMMLVFLSTLSSHSPKRIRHYNWLHALGKLGSMSHTSTRRKP